MLRRDQVIRTDGPT